MPMQITVSRNRKRSENYNSEGHGISLTVELDQALLGRPGELQSQVAQLYREAEQALDQQAGGAPQHETDHPGHPDRRGGNGDAARSHPGGNGNGSRRNGHMTDSQRRAIHAIGRKLGFDVAEECYSEFGSNLDDLDVRGASKLIDHLKGLQTTPGNGNGGRR